MNLQLFIEKRNLSQNQLALLSGVSQAQVSRIISGQQPRLATLEKLAEALGVTVGELIGEKQKRKPKAS